MRKCFIFLILVALMISMADAERIKIIIMDNEENPVAGASLTISLKDTQEVLESVLTDGDGVYVAYMNSSVEYMVDAKKESNSNTWIGFPRGGILYIMI
jgi:hypothetical protein